MNETVVTAPDRKLSPFAVAAFLLMIVAALGLRAKQWMDDRRPILVELAVHGQSFTVEVADTPAKKELGLGKRDVLPEGRGMYFPFAEARTWAFWMKDMRFPIDIVWIRQGTVVDIHRDVPVPEGGRLETYASIEPVDAVLELPAGTAEKAGIRAGDKVSLRALDG